MWFILNSIHNEQLQFDTSLDYLEIHSRLQFYEMAEIICAHSLVNFSVDLDCIYFGVATYGFTVAHIRFIYQDQYSREICPYI